MVEPSVALTLSADDRSPCDEALLSHEMVSHLTTAPPATLDRSDREALLRYAAHLLGTGLGPHTADDVVQDTLARYHAAPAEVTQGLVDGQRQAWLFTTCRRRCLDLRRKERRMTTLAPETLDARPTPHPQATTPLRLAEQRDDYEQALRQMAGLPEAQQEVVRLKFQAGLTYAQIAEVTGQTTSQVGYLLHQALKTLRQQMKR